MKNNSLSVFWVLCFVPCLFVNFVCKKARDTIFTQDFNVNVPLVLSQQQGSLDIDKFSSKTIAINLKHTLENTNKVEEVQIDSIVVFTNSLNITNQNSLDFSKLKDIKISMSVYKNGQYENNASTLFKIGIKNNNTKKEPLDVNKSLFSHFFLTDSIKMDLEGSSLVDITGIYDADLNIVLRAYTKPLKVL